MLVRKVNSDRQLQQTDLSLRTEEHHSHEKNFLIILYLEFLI